MVMVPASAGPAKAADAANTPSRVRNIGRRRILYGSIQQATGLAEPSGWHSVATSGAFRARIVRTFTAELAPGLETITVISVPTLSCFLSTGASSRRPAVFLNFR